MHLITAKKWIALQITRIILELNKLKKKIESLQEKKNAIVTNHRNFL